MLRRRTCARAALPVAALALLTAAPAALAATAPVVKNPTPASLNQSRPFFTWTNGPGGEHVDQISIRTEPTTDANGYMTGKFAANVPTSGGLTASRTSARTDKGLIAGTYYWNARWRDPVVGDFAFSYTPVRRFTIRPNLRNVRIDKVEASSRGFSGRMWVRLLGRVATNAGSFTGNCRIFNGSKLVSAQSISYTSQDPLALNPMGCLRLQIPERLSGTQLRAVVNIRAGGRTRTATRFFVIR